MSLRKALLAATMLSLPLAAQAQPVTGLYVGAGAGANWHQNSTDDGVKIESSPGWGVVASLGWGFGNGLRAEVEGNFRWNDVDRITVSGLPGPTSERLVRRSGYIKTYGVMANALYDIGAVQRWPVHITLGAGIGWAWHEYDNVGGQTRFQSPNTAALINDTDGRFAYQAIAGLSVPIEALPGLAVTAEYRFFGTLSPKLNATVTDLSTGVRTTGRYEADNLNHSLLVGVRYNFGQVA
ncbi:outer membrane protein, partial [Caldovatus aquaticus]